MQQSVAEVELDKLAVLCGSLRLHCGSDGDIRGKLLEPIAGVLGAEAAACRHLRLQPAHPQIEKLISIGVPASVRDDYLSHFHRFDPFLAPAATGGFTASGDNFQHYYQDFLHPNGLVHHTGFRIHDARHQRLWIFNFHRPAAAAAFSSLEHTRSRMIEACLQGQAASAAQADVVRPDAEVLAPLTCREREIVTAMARGYANKQIAATLAISPRTVENHLRNIYEKLQINTRTQLLSLLHRQNYTLASPDTE